MDTFDISKNTVPTKSKFPSENQTTDKKPIPNDLLRQPAQLQPQREENHHHSQRETQRSKRSEDTAVALEMLLDGIYINDATAAKKYKKKCASLKSQIHVLQSENQQLANALKVQNKKKTQDSTDDCPTYRISPRYNDGVRTQSSGQTASEKDGLHSEVFKFLEKLNEVVTGDNRMTYNEILDNRMELLKKVLEWKTEQSKLTDIYGLLHSLREEFQQHFNIHWTAATGKTPSLMLETTSQEIVKLIQNIRQDLKIQGTALTNIETSGDSLTYDQMRFVILHFMKLFDVKKESAVYTRIYDLYVRYYEVSNALNTIHHMLHLKKANGINDIVNAVGKVTKLKKHLRTQKIDRMMNEVEEYDQFYEAFHKLVEDLKDMLGVSELEGILPAVKHLQQHQS